MRKFLVALCVGLFASTTRVDVECRAIRGNPEVCNRTPGCGFREVYFFRHPELDFGQKSPPPPPTRNSEHGIVFDDFMSALEHEFHAPEGPESSPSTLGI